MRREQKRHRRILKEEGGAAPRQGGRWRERVTGYESGPRKVSVDTCTHFCIAVLTILHFTQHSNELSRERTAQHNTVLRVRVEECTIDRWTGKKEAASEASEATH